MWCDDTYEIRRLYALSRPAYLLQGIISSVQRSKRRYLWKAVNMHWRRCLSALAWVADVVAKSHFLRCSCSHLPSRPPILFSFSATDSFSILSHLSSAPIPSAQPLPPRQLSRVRANHKGQVDNGRTIALSTTTLFSHARSHRTLDHSSHLSGTTHSASGRVLVSSRICWRGWGIYRLIFKLYR